MRRIRIVLLLLILTSISTVASASSDIASDALLHAPDQSIENVDTAIALLQQGNFRFVTGNLSDKGDYTRERAVLQEGQTPFAVVLTCSDSRVAPEIHFDQELGDIFTIRNAGNVVDSSVLGSIEYAVEYLNVSLVVVVGHSRCGAVTAACAGGEHSESLQSILNQIAPACEEAVDVDTALCNHSVRMVGMIQSNDIVLECGALVIGAHYAIEDGVVTWLDNLAS